MKTYARTLLVIAALIASGSPAGVSAVAAADNVRLGQISISFYAVTGQVVQAVLERLGHRVELTTGSHAQIFPSVGDGSVDLLVAAWLPYAHAKYWREYGSDAVELTDLYSGAQLFWAVPHYVPAADVASVEDLKKPEVRSRMEKHIRTTKPDSGLSMGSQRVMQAYQLESHGYTLQPGSHLEWQKYFEDNYQAGSWFVMPYFRPNFLNRMAVMRKLDEPDELLGRENRAVLVAHRKFVERAPGNTLRVLRRIELDLDTVAEMDFMVRVEGLSPRDAARNWMSANAERVDAWFAVQ